MQRCYLSSTVDLDCLRFICFLLYCCSKAVINSKKAFTVFQVRFHTKHRSLAVLTLMSLAIFGTFLKIKMSFERIFTAESFATQVTSPIIYSIHTPRYIAICRVCTIDWRIHFYFVCGTRCDGSEKSCMRCDMRCDRIMLCENRIKSHNFSHFFFVE